MNIPIHALVAKTEADERDLLLEFWSIYEATLGMRLITFHGHQYDLPLIQQRSLYLDVACTADINVDRYRSPHSDLALFLGRNDAGEIVMRRTLTAWCRRFGLDVPDDDSTGSDIGALVAAGDWEAVVGHCDADVRKTLVLAERVRLAHGPALVLDLETVAIDGADGYMEDVKAPGNLKDPAKIEAAIAAKKSKAALDINLARIVCFGYALIPSPNAVQRTTQIEAQVF